MRNVQIVAPSLEYDLLHGPIGADMGNVDLIKGELVRIDSGINVLLAGQAIAMSMFHPAMTSAAPPMSKIEYDEMNRRHWNKSERMQSAQEKRDRKNAKRLADMRKAKANG